MFFFFNDTATTEIYTLSLHDALPISGAASMALSSTFTNTCASCSWSIAQRAGGSARARRSWRERLSSSPRWPSSTSRSEEHTSELQSRQYLVCRLLLEKKKNTQRIIL